jgi:hypothetical protein
LPPTLIFLQVDLEFSGIKIHAHIERAVVKLDSNLHYSRGMIRDANNLFSNRFGTLGFQHQRLKRSEFCMDGAELGRDARSLQSSTPARYQMATRHAEVHYRMVFEEIWLGYREQFGTARALKSRLECGFCIK